MGLYIERKVEGGHTPSRTSSKLVLHVSTISLTHFSVAIVMVFIVLIAIFNEMGNGANFSLVPHCNPCKRLSLISPCSDAPSYKLLTNSHADSNGMMSGIVGRFTYFTRIDHSSRGPQTNRCIRQSRRYILRTCFPLPAFASRQALVDLRNHHYG